MLPQNSLDAELSLNKADVEDIKVDTRFQSTEFHYDVIDLKALTLFIYLTDVDESSGPHVLIEGSHRENVMTKVAHQFLHAETAEEKYGDRIRWITGKKGTGFFEDLTIYHRQSPTIEKPRLVFQINYVLQRKATCLSPVQPAVLPSLST